jgi:hypothetical protein
MKIARRRSNIVNGGAPPPDQRVVTTINVLERSYPVLTICHFDDEDETWAFLCDTTENEDDLRIVELERILQIEPTLSRWLHLPAGWSAERDQPGEPWITEPESPLGLVSTPSRGYFLDFEPPSPRFHHEFCGVHDIPGAICPNCLQPMTFLAAVCDETLDGRGFTENSWVQVLFLLCRKDRVILSFQECD